MVEAGSVASCTMERLKAHWSLFSSPNPVVKAGELLGFTGRVTSVGSQVREGTVATQTIKVRPSRTGS